MTLNVRRLQVLLQLSRSGTMAATAEELRYSPASVSQQIGQLEREVGVSLVQATGRTVRLTSAGRQLAQRAGRILEEMGLAEREAAWSNDSPGGRIVIGIFQSAAMALLPSVYAHLAVRYPDIRLAVRHLEPRSALGALERHEVDIAVLEEFPGSPLPRPRSIAIRTIGLDPLWLAAPRGSVKRLTPDMPWAMEPPGTAARSWGESYCRERGFEPDVQFESHDLTLHRRLVSIGLANAFLPELGFDGAYPDDVILEPLPDAPSRSIVLAKPSFALEDPAITALDELLSAALAQFARSKSFAATRSD